MLSVHLNVEQYRSVIFREHFVKSFIYDVSSTFGVLQQIKPERLEAISSNQFVFNVILMYLFSFILLTDNYATRPPPTDCSLHQATCMNGECIPKQKLCDGVYDCKDGSDESSCSNLGRCEPNEFRCNNQKCVLKTWRCGKCSDPIYEKNPFRDAVTRQLYIHIKKRKLSVTLNTNCETRICKYFSSLILCHLGHKNIGWGRVICVAIL